MPWWVVFLGDNGNPNLRGPYRSRGLAQDKLDTLDVEGEIYSTSTWNRDEATRVLKNDRVDEYGVGEGMKKFRHKVEVEEEV